MPTKYYLILSKTIGVQWLTIEFNDMTLIIIQKFIFHCLNLKVCFWTVHFEIAEAGPRPRSRPGVVTNLRNLTDVSWPLLVPLTRSTPYWSYLFTLLSTLTLWKIHAGLNQDQRRLYRRQAILRQDGGRRTEKRQLRLPWFPQPSAPTIQTCLSHHFLGLGDAGFLIHHPSSSLSNPWLFYEIIKFCTTAAGKKFVKITPLSGIVWNCMIHFVFSIYSKEIIA